MYFEVLGVEQPQYTISFQLWEYARNPYGKSSGCPLKRQLCTGYDWNASSLAPSLKRVKSSERKLIFTK